MVGYKWEDQKRNLQPFANVPFLSPNAALTGARVRVFSSVRCLPRVRLSSMLDSARAEEQRQDENEESG